MCPYELQVRMHHRLFDVKSRGGQETSNIQFVDLSFGSYGCKNIYLIFGACPTYHPDFWRCGFNGDLRWRRSQICKANRTETNTCSWRMRSEWDLEPYCYSVTASGWINALILSSDWVETKTTWSGCDVTEETEMLVCTASTTSRSLRIYEPYCPVRLCPRRGKLSDAYRWLMCFLRGNVHSFHCNINFCITALQPLWERVIYNNPSVLDLSKEARGRGRTREARRKGWKLLLNSLQ